MRHRTVSALLAAAALPFAAVAAAAQPATVQKAPAGAPAEIESISIIGTAIRGTPADSPYAVSVIERESLDARGAPLLVDVFKNLGASQGVVGERSSWFNGGQPTAIPESAANVNLRGLGASRTLVLINGRRQTYLPARLVGGRFVDVNVLPPIALQRIEVLKEGASAIYGSDAVAGIANFQTRENFRGLEISAAHENYQGAGQTNLGAIGGLELGAAHAVFALEHARQGELTPYEKPWALQPLLDPWRGAWSSVGNPGHFIIPAAALDTQTMARAAFAEGMAAGTGMPDPECEGLSGAPAQSYTCLFNYQPYDNLIEKINRTRAFAELNGELPGGDGEYHLEALYSEATTPQWTTQPSHPPFPYYPRGLVEIAPAHPARIAFCADAEYSAAFRAACDAAQPVNWYWRGRPAGNGAPRRTARRETRTWRLAAEVQREFQTFGKELYAEAALSYSHSEGNVNVPAMLTQHVFLAARGYGGPDCGVGVTADNNLPMGMRVEAGAPPPGSGGCEYFNPFSSAVQFSSLPWARYYQTPNPRYQAARANSQELFDWLNGESEITSETQLLVMDLSAGGEWNEFISFAWGYQFRRFAAEGRPNYFGDLAQNPCLVIGRQNCGSESFGLFTFINAHHGYEESQNVHRIFGELALAPAGNVDVQIALNYERYEEDASTDPKLALRWRALESLTVRASLQTTFRTPSVDDLQSNTPLTATELISTTGAWIPVDTYGDPALKPEQAFTTNLGLVWFPISQMEISLDYWNYNFEDVIAALPANSLDNLYADEATRAGVLQFIHCSAGRADRISTPCAARDITRVEVPLVNWPGVKSAGLDWRIAGEFELGPGALNTELSGAVTLDYTIKALSHRGLNIAESEAAGKLNFGSRLAPPLPDWKARWLLAYRWDDYSVNTQLNYISSYEDQGAYDGFGGRRVPDFRVDEFLTWDVILQWRLPAWGAQLSLALFNLTDKAPPFANVEHAYDGLTHNPKGRRLKLELRYRFGD